MSEYTQTMLFKNAWKTAGDGHIMHDAAAQGHGLAGILAAQPEGQFIQPGHQTHMKTPADDRDGHAAMPLAVNLCEKFQSVQFQKAIFFD